jgi:acetyl esterase/lipase
VADSFFDRVTPASPTIPAGAEYIGGVQFAQRSSGPLFLDLFRPAKRPSNEMLPLVIYIFGGAWMIGNRYQFGGLVPGAGKLIDDCYVVAAIDYRLSQQAIFPAQIHDVKSAIYWLRAHAADYQIDADRIGIWGPSAGGHLSALAGTSAGRLEPPDASADTNDGSRVQAVVDFFGPTNFLAMREHMLTSFDHDGPDSPESRLVGGPIGERAQAVKEANPITYISGDEPPFLLVHGIDDPIVPFNQSEILASALRSAGVDVTFRPIEGGGHGTGEEFDSPALMDIITKFFDRHLKR